jgi:hypothetical protein
VKVDEEKGSGEGESVGWRPDRGEVKLVDSSARRRRLEIFWQTRSGELVQRNNSVINWKRCRWTGRCRGRKKRPPERMEGQVPVQQ